MSSTNTASNIATQAGQHTAYAVERTKQEVCDTQKSAEAAANSYLEQTKNTTSQGVNAAGATLGQTTTQVRKATDDFERQASAKTNQAVNEGQRDVEEAKAAGIGYFEQAKQVVNDGVTAAKQFVASSTEPQASYYTDSTTNTEESSLLSSIQSTASSAFETAKSYAASAQETAMPQLQKAHAAVKPQIDAAITTAQPYVERAQATISSAFGSEKGSDGSSTNAV